MTVRTYEDGVLTDLYYDKLLSVSVTYRVNTQYQETVDIPVTVEGGTQAGTNPATGSRNILHPANALIGIISHRAFPNYFT